MTDLFSLDFQTIAVLHQFILNIKCHQISSFYNAI